MISIMCIGALASPVYAKQPFSLEVSYWRLLDANTSLSEEAREGSSDSEIDGLGLSASTVVTKDKVVDIGTDASKWLFHAQYRFVDSFYRLALGIEYASTGNAKSKKISFIDQPFDLVRIFDNFDARNIKYLNLYAKYRLFPLDAGADYLKVEDRGMDVYLSHVSWTQEFSAGGSSFETQAKSLAVGVGVENTSRNGLFKFTGRVNYLPFFSLDGSGFDGELKVSFRYNPWISVFAGYKWVDIEVEDSKTVAFTGVSGFSGTAFTYDILDVEANGYLLGVQVEF